LPPTKWSCIVNLLNNREFVYFLCGLSPSKRHVVRRRNFAYRRVTTMCRTCAGFYVYRGRRYENSDIFSTKCVQFCLRVSAVGLYSWQAALLQPRPVLLIALRVLDKAEYSAFESTLNSSIVSYHNQSIDHLFLARAPHVWKQTEMTTQTKKEERLLFFHFFIF